MTPSVTQLSADRVNVACKGTQADLVRYRCSGGKDLLNRPANKQLQVCSISSLPETIIMSSGAARGSRPSTRLGLWSSLLYDDQCHIGGCFCFVVKAYLTPSCSNLAR